MKYLKEFILGSSFIIFAPFYYTFYKIKKESYYNYTFIAPLWFGIWNVISLIISEKFNLSIRSRYIIISFISYLTVISYATYSEYYKFKKKDWCRYYIIMLITYLLVWNVVIYNTEKLISYGFKK